MKELHNHIFSNTTCISKESMLRYINKQLTKSELYEVEKHMLDCELCSDAYEGMQFAQNASILFAIDNQIDQRVGSGNAKAPIMRNLMVAASVMLIVCGAYFTFDFFNDTVESEKGFAINNPEELKNEEQPIEESVVLEDLELNNQSNLASGKSIGDALDDDKQTPKKDEQYRTTINTLSPIMVEQSLKINDVVSEDAVDELDEEEIIVAANVERAKKAKGESKKQLESSGDTPKMVTSDNRRQENFAVNVQPESVTISNEKALGGALSKADKSGELLKKETKNKTRSSGDKKQRFKSNEPSSPGYFANGKLEESESFRDRNQENTVTIDSYKVVDYTEEYQREYDLKNATTVETKSVSADFEGRTDKDVAEKEKEEIIVEITYKETLDKAINFYKSKNYNLAIEQFDIILKEHPDEVNGWFYGGLSDYHLKRYDKANEKLSKVLINKKTQFNEEASWYKALTLIELKQIDKAKTLLKTISSENGFYKDKAKEKLNGL